MLKGIENDVPFDSGTAKLFVATCEAVAPSSTASVGHGRRGRRRR